ncbi:hypothetical protein [Candidatus Nitrosocosmicus sp. FF01]
MNFDRYKQYPADEYGKSDAMTMGTANWSISSSKIICQVMC